MKVLIETITSRRGYKNFADEAELDDFLAHIRFIFFRPFQKYIMGINVMKTKGFKEFDKRKIISFK